ncbi:TetR/AcrR family transcriptional regulator [Actinoplanes sp. NBRC 101535]|uniref:TetR/AcrR family transcriptional regulator n=1 Tax=Actinoplanes sp. NBRC 101535 TaxID=3032196 RepID=UPI0024A22C55|nr:TetR/AcrR family transcriptional regulator [Actinoplanes sp. NBRC 101535]GLY07518.1 TetR family transcriptional regulator [Actinoplanes sp. NBRC 101535]
MDVDLGLRDRLVRAGVELLRSEGPTALTLREIARRAGVSHGAPRRHFPTHLSLLSAIAAAGFTSLAQRCDAALSGPEADTRRRLALLAGVYLDFAASERGMFELMFRHDLLESGHLGLRDTSLPLFRLLTTLIAETRATPAPEVTAAALWSALHGLAQLRAWGSLRLVTGSDDIGPTLDAILTAHLGPAT